MFLGTAAKNRPFGGNSTLNTNLLAWYNCEDNAADTVVTDATGKFHGTAYANSTTVTTNTSTMHSDNGRKGGCFDCQGAYVFNSQFETVAGDIFDIDKKFSISIFFYWDGLTSVQYFLGNMNTSLMKGLRAYQSAGVVYVQLMDTGGVYIRTITDNINPGWNHVLLGNDGLSNADSLIAFVNKSNENQTSAKVGLPTNTCTSIPMTFGRGGDYLLAEWPDKIDLIGVWKDTTPTQEMANLLYEYGTHVLKEKEDKYGLVHYKMQDNAADTIVTDALGNTNGVATSNTDTLFTTGGPKEGCFNGGYASGNSVELPVEDYLGQYYSIDKPWAVSFLLHTPTATAISYPIGCSNASGNGGWAFQMDNRSGTYTTRFRIYDVATSSYWGQSGFNLTGLATGWVHVLLGYDGSGAYTGMKEFIDGVETTAGWSGSAVTDFTPPNNVSIIDANGTYDGLMGEVAFFQEAPTQAMADSCRVGISKEYMDKAIAYYPCNDNQDNTIVSDRGRHHKHGTATHDTSLLYSSAGYNGCFDFSAGTESITAAIESVAGDTFDVDKTFTVSQWVYKTSSGSILGITGNATSVGIGTYSAWVGTVSKARFYMRNETNVPAMYRYIQGDLITGWNHIVYGNDGSDSISGMSFYINKVKQTSTGSSGPTSGVSVASSDDFMIGNVNYVANYDEKIARPRVLSCEPTQELVDELYYDFMPSGH
jgi:hypothetical protein